MTCEPDKVGDARLLQIVLYKIILYACWLMMMMIRMETETCRGLQCPNAMELCKYQD